jgi:hypothetical protein
MTLEITNGGGAQTLDIKQPEWQDEGYAVVGDVATPGSGPLAVTIGSGVLGAGNGALSVGSGDALVGGSTVSNAGVSVDIEAGDSEPRKDVVWIDNTGSVRVDKGTPTGILPQGASGFESYVPPVPFPGTTPATVLAAVFVPANADEIDSGDIQDRRLPADVVRSSVDSNSLSTDEAIIDGISMDVIGSETQSGTTSSSTTLSVSDIPRDDAIYVEFDLLPQSSGLLQMQIDGDTSSNYAYFDETGSKATGQTSIELFDYDSFPEISGPVRISIISITDRPAVVNLGSASKIFNLNGFATKAALSNSVGDPFSISITSTGGLSAGDSITVKRAFQ